MELLKEAAAKRKDDPEVLYYLGEVYRQLKQYTECKGELERALTLTFHPDSRMTQGVHSRGARKHLLCNPLPG